MKYQHVMFDLDGTLMNTSEGILKSVKHTIKSLSLPDVSNETLKKFIGPPIEKSFEEYIGLTKKDAAEAAAVFRRVYPDLYLYEASFYDGIENLLLSLKKSGIKISVATYKRGSYTSKLLKQFNVYETFDYVVGSDDEGKLTKTDIINKCVDLSGISKNQTVMIGDTKHDAISSRETGIDFIAVTYGFGFKTQEDTKDYSPVCVCDSVNEVSMFLYK